MAKELKPHEGHRQRMYARLETDPQSLSECEILEIMLYQVLPRVDTVPMARSLLAKFGSVKGVFSAEKEALTTVDGVGKVVANYLFTLGKCFYYLPEESTAMPNPFERKSFERYIIRKLGGFSTEQLEFYALDEQGFITACKEFSSEKSSSVTISPIELSKFICENMPKSVIMVHNHPSGYALPSKDDHDATLQCCVLCMANNVLLYDHYICAGDDVFSYHQSGRLATIRSQTNITKMLYKHHHLT